MFDMSIQNYAAPPAITDLRDTACLVSPRIRMWHGRKQKSNLARAGAQALAAQSGKHIDTNMVSGTTVHLIDKTRIDVLRQAADLARASWRHRTLPWRDDGTRICRNKGILTLKGELEAARNLFMNTLVPQFVNDFADLKRQAMYSLGPLYDPNDYPDDITRCFSFDIVIEQLPDVNDFRLSGVSQVDLQDWLTATEQSVQDSLREAQADSWRRLLEPIQKMGEALRNYDPNAVGANGKRLKGFEQSLIDNVAKIADVVTDINLFDDPMLEAFAQAARGLLTTYDAKDLKDDENIRVQIADRADDLVERINAQADELINAMSEFV